MAIFHCYVSSPEGIHKSPSTAPRKNAGFHPTTGADRFEPLERGPGLWRSHDVNVG